MDLQLTGRTALVAGGTRGIGRAVVEALAAEGARVAFCARTAADVARAEEELRASGAEVAVSGRTSSRTTRSCSTRRWPSTRPAGWALQRRRRTRW